jgi:hypothetical protein
MTPDAMKSIENVRQTLEDIDHYLERKRRINGAPLAYIVRPTVEAPDEATQQFGLPTFDGDLIARARHEGTVYQQDNKLVWTMLRAAPDGTGSLCTNWRTAYLAVKSHYLGEAFQSCIRTAADKILDDTFFDGNPHVYI